MLHRFVLFGSLGGLVTALSSCGGPAEKADASRGGTGGEPAAVLPEGGANAFGGAGGGYELSGDGTCERVGLCGLLECDTGKLTGDHVSACSSLTFETNPPTSGPHYPVWAQFGIYNDEVPRGYWLHTIEHSAIALLYNCDEAAKVGLDCEELKAQLTAYYNAYPKDELCTAAPHRLFVAPDSKLDAPFAAVAWGFYLKGVCFDPDAVTAFATKHYGMNYENICANGIAPATCP